MPALFKSGDVIRAVQLPAGHPIVLAVRGDHIMCVLPDMPQPFVTWWVSARGEVLSGTYHGDIGDAIRALTARAGQPAAKPDTLYLGRDDLEGLSQAYLAHQLNLFVRRHGYTVPVGLPLDRAVRDLIDTLDQNELSEHSHINWLGAWRDAYQAAAFDSVMGEG